MNEDPRCCGSGTCIIDTEDRCWCGQQWNGDKMCATHRRPWQMDLIGQTWRSHSARLAEATPVP